MLTIDLTKKGPSVHLINDIIKAATSMGHKPIVLMRDHNGNKEILPKEHIEYIFVEDNPINKNNFIIRYIDELKYSLKCIKDLKKLRKIDAIFLQSSPVAGFLTFFVKRFLSAPILYNVQDIFPDDVLYVKKWKKSNIIYKILKLTQVYAYNKASKIITISEDMKNNLIDSGINNNKIHVIYNWSYSDSLIEIPYYQNEFAKRFMLNNQKTKVLYAGNIGKKQNIDIIIQAARELKLSNKIEFLLVGDGDVNHYKNLVANEQLNVSFFPLQDSKYAEDVYACADIIIITLKRGIIYTALPSKTATCLRLNTNIIFCLDNESIFAKSIMDYSNTYVCDCEDGVELARIISNISKEIDKKQKNTAFNFFINNMSCKKNPYKYIREIESMSHQNNERAEV